jgi:1-deoxy-D-xylulose-5-phosphate synthase
MSQFPMLESISTPADLKRLDVAHLETVAAEIRRAICDQVARTGGHLAPNLGVVELTLALHYVFDFSHDRLLFDVGHQCYPHKLLTGRFAELGRLRQRDGIAGFPEPRESAFDLFFNDTATTEIYTALGMARADSLNGESDRRAVALVGDSSIVNGLALEGLNNAGTLSRQLLVVLNDNGMSIGAAQGALASYFDKIRIQPRYADFKQQAHKLLQHVPAGGALEELYHRLAEMTKAAVGHPHLFEDFGLLCVGPVDGHELGGLIHILETLKTTERPVLLHCKTVKGKGFDFSSDDPTTFHSPPSFRVDGCRVELSSAGRSFTKAYADAMIDLMERDPKVVAVTAGMPDGTGISEVMPRFPERTFDVGISESHATAMCAGMAKAGLRPFAAIYSTFLQRGFDQIFQEVALQGLPVRFCMDRGGLVGGDGAVHHGFLDVAFLRSFPGMTLMAAIDEVTLRGALEFMVSHDDGPSAVRYPRDKVPNPVQGADSPAFVRGRANLLADGNDLAILAYGFPANHALQARELLREQGVSVRVYDARFAKPLDLELVRELVSARIPMLTVEDHHISGGFGAAVLEACNEHGLSTRHLHRIGLPDRWIYQGSRDEQLAEAGIDAAGIVDRVLEILGPAGKAAVDGTTRRLGLSSAS